MYQEGRGLGRDLTDQGCSPTLPKQGQQSRSGDSDQSQLRVQRLPDKSAGTRQISGQAGKSGQRVGVIKVHGQVQASLQGGFGKDQEPEMRLLPQLFAWTLMAMLRLHCVSAGCGHR